jgi:hypothetical protein
MAGQIAKNYKTFMTAVAGEIQEEEGGTVYLLDTDLDSGAPIIYNPTTKKYWSIGWEELLRMAKDAGIDTEWEK